MLDLRVARLIREQFEDVKDVGRCGVPLAVGVDSTKVHGRHSRRSYAVKVVII